MQYLESRTLLAAAFTEFVDPHPVTGNQFGATIVSLSNGNVVITAPFDDAGASNAGAVYLFNGGTGALISTLTGSNTNDNLGSGGVTALSNGNFVVSSPLWGSNDVGAVTWVNGTTGLNDNVDGTNSLVGSMANDQVGSAGVTVLSGNGNYVVASPLWDGTTSDTGAVTWANGTTGVSGTISSANSLVGSTINDKVGDRFNGVSVITVLGNGNYLVRSPFWNNGVTTDAGAVTWGSGTNGVSGTISSANSLVGSTANDFVGVDGVTVLSNNNYVVRSVSWDNGAFTNAGAATWVDGTTGLTGDTSNIISSANSLVGNASNQQVSRGGVTALTNGNYVVGSYLWASLGAATWVDGTTGLTSNSSNTISAANSLVGSSGDDRVGTSITALINGNYVVHSPFWSPSALGVNFKGAVTWGNGSTGTTGAVSAGNSLVGTVFGDSIGSGGVTALTNGNYVVSSPSWSDGVSSAVGAATWGDGAAGSTKGTISSSNSLVGSSNLDQVGYRSVRALSNGNYVVVSPLWDNTTTPTTDAGAATWGNGTTGTSGIVSDSNSLVGQSANDRVGDPSGSLSGSYDYLDSVTILNDGNYVVHTWNWDNGAATDAGAVTWRNGSTSTPSAGAVVSDSNSLVGSSTNDRVGYSNPSLPNYLNSVTILSNNTYVVNSPLWNNGGTTDAGAVTWVNGAAGVTGIITNLNSLVGTHTNDQIGSMGVTALDHGNYAIGSPLWNSGGTTDAGAVTFGDGTTGVVDVIDTVNSAIGFATSTGLQSVVVDHVNDTFFGRFRDEGRGYVRVGSQTSGFRNSPPSAVALQNTTSSLPENTSTASRVKIADIVVTDDALGTETLSLSGTDAASFEIVSGALYIKQGVVLDYETKSSYAVTVQVDDNTVGSTPDATVPYTLTLTDVNDVPVISGAVSNQPVNDNSTKMPFSTLTVADADNQSMSAIVRINNGAFRGDFTAGAVAGWTRSTSGNDIQYAKTFAAAPNIGSVVQSAIRSFVFQPRLNAIVPNTTETTAFTVTVADGIATPVSNSSTTVITTSVNDAPSIAGASFTVAVNDSATINPFTTLTVTDADNQEMLISVTILNGLFRGDFTSASVADWPVRYTTGNDITYKRYFSPGPNVGATAQAAFRALVFQPRMNAINPGTTELTDFQVTVSDGVAAAIANTGTRVTTTSVNDNPTLGGAVAGQTMNDNQTKSVFDTLTVTDADYQDMLARVTITNGVNRGDFTSASTSGWTRSVSGNDIIYNRYFSPTNNVGSVVQTAIRAMVFQPRANAIAVNSTETTTFTVYVYDGMASTTNSTTSVVTTSVNDAPTIGGAASNQTMDDDQTKAVFSTLTITDGDYQEDMVARITIVNGVNRGDFTSASATSWTRAVVGADIRYERYFSPGGNIGSTVQAAIRALIFQPRNNVPVNTQETTAFTVFVNDGITTATDNATSVVTTGVAPRPAASAIVTPPPILETDTSILVLPTVTVPRTNMFARLLNKKSR